MSSESPNQPEKERSPARLIVAALRRWWFVIIPIVVLVEISLHGLQTRTVMHPEDWSTVRASLESRVEPADLIVLAPKWIDPVGRMHLGDALMTTERVARADVSRFPRAFEVGLKRARSKELRSWSLEQEERIGPFRLRTLRNPLHRPVIDDLLSHVDGTDLEVSMIRKEQHQPCTWKKGMVITGTLGFGPAAPAERFHCPRNIWVGKTINADLDYLPRRCIYAPPPGGDQVLQLRFRKVQFGQSLEGHHALYVEAEREGKGTPIKIALSSDGRPLGEAIHEDGQGWVSFAFDTSGLAGQEGQLLVEISSQRGDRRMYCFEATTR